MKRLDNGNIEITVTIAWADVQKAYEKTVLHYVSQAEIPGFRKGKAPREAVEAKLDRNKVYSQALQDLLPKLYTDAVKTHDLKPILYPKVTITKGKEGEDWEVLFVTCEAPTKGENTVLPAMLVEEEANHRLGLLAENLSKLGLTTDAYLASKKMTLETLLKNTRSEAEIALKAEFSKK